VVLLPFRVSWPDTNVALLLVVVVVGVATGNRVAGGLAAVRAALWFDFFFTIRSPADITTAVLLLVTGLAVSQLAARALRLKVFAVTDAGYLAQIRQTAARAKPATVPDLVVSHVREQQAGLLDLEGARSGYGSCPAGRRACSPTGP
jgi:K+-sensing histidine kinase KdpD